MHVVFKFSKLYIPLFQKSNGIHLDLVPGSEPILFTKQAQTLFFEMMYMYMNLLYDYVYMMALGPLFICFPFLG